MFIICNLMEGECCIMIFVWFYYYIFSDAPKSQKLSTLTVFRDLARVVSFLNKMENACLFIEQCQ